MRESDRKRLVVLLGPTGVGKTDLSLMLSEQLEAPIVSSDSRQLYREMIIGTAAPDEAALAKRPHYFIGCKSIVDHYSAGQYELDVLSLLENELYPVNNDVLLVGGSMLYIDAVCNGIDDLPTIDEELRAEVQALYQEKGLAHMRAQLKLLDPVYYSQVDLMNVQRILHALEVCFMTNRPFSSFHKNAKKRRFFDIKKVGLTLPQEQLYERINRRVDLMMEKGLEAEARSLYPYRHLNSLNTVGYKELFLYFDGEWTKDYAVAMIKQNTRHYAKKQLSWFMKDSEIKWFEPSQKNDVCDYLRN